MSEDCGEQPEHRPLAMKIGEICRSKRIQSGSCLTAPVVWGSGGAGMNFPVATVNWTFPELPAKAIASRSKTLRIVVLN